MTTKTTDQDFKVVTCYNCQDKFFAWIPDIKSINFCSYCWAKAGK